MFSFKNLARPYRHTVPSHVADKKILFSYAPDWCVSLEVLVLDVKQRLTCLFRSGYSPPHWRMCLYTSDAVFANSKDITSLAFFLLDKFDGFQQEFSVSDTSCATPFPYHRKDYADRRLLDYVTRELSLLQCKTT